uniref:Uncharacterized protein n=1 Tax=Poecilia reticulata TaxID=8081 RepID=A0A3P9QCZ5_POERE
IKTAGGKLKHRPWRSLFASHRGRVGCNQRGSCVGFPAPCSGDRLPPCGVRGSTVGSSCALCGSAAAEGAKLNRKHSIVTS